MKLVDKKVKDKTLIELENVISVMERINHRLDLMDGDVKNIKAEMSKIKSNLDAYVNKHSCEIRVLPEGSDPDKHGAGGWEEYSGKFDLDNYEENSIVVGKAMNHFETYFKDGVYHRNKKLGLFLSNKRSGKHLIEEMETGDEQINIKERSNGTV